jgi:transposase
MGQHDSKRPKRQYKQYSDEFKADTVELVLATGRAVAHVAQELGVNQTTLGNWVRIERDLRAEEAAGGLDRDERAELAAARVELAQLRVERDLLKRTVAFWVKESTP